MRSTRDGQIPSSVPQDRLFTQDSTVTSVIAQCPQSREQRGQEGAEGRVQRRIQQFLCVGFWREIVIVIDETRENVGEEVGEGLGVLLFEGAKRREPG